MAENEDNKPRKIFTDIRTRTKIDKHLRDINDEITESDIANVRTDITSEAADPESEKHVKDEVDEILSEKEKNNKKEDGNNENDIQTPWNVVGS